MIRNFIFSKGKLNFSKRKLNSLWGNWISVRGNWISVRGNWFSVRGNWISVRVNWISERGNWISVRGNWISVGGNWISVRGNWISFGGNWFSLGGKRPANGIVEIIHINSILIFHWMKDERKESYPILFTWTNLYHIEFWIQSSLNPFPLTSKIKLKKLTLKYFQNCRQNILINN